MATQSALLDPVLAGVFLKGKENYEDLSPVESLQFQVIMSNLLYEYEIVLDQQRAGFVSDELVTPYHGYYEELVSHRGVKLYLEKNRDLHGPTFKQLLDQQLA